MFAKKQLENEDIFDLRHEGVEAVFVVIVEQVPDLVHKVHDASDPSLVLLELLARRFGGLFLELLAQGLLGAEEGCEVVGDPLLGDAVDLEQLGVEDLLAVDVSIVEDLVLVVPVHPSAELFDVELHVELAFVV